MIRRRRKSRMAYIMAGIYLAVTVVVILTATVVAVRGMFTPELPTFEPLRLEVSSD